MIPLLIGFGLLAVLILVPRNTRKELDDRAPVSWLIILLMVGLVIFGSIPYLIGLKEGMYP